MGTAAALSSTAPLTSATVTETNSSAETSDATTPRRWKPSPSVSIVGASKPQRLMSSGRTMKRYSPAVTGPAAFSAQISQRYAPTGRFLRSMLVLNVERANSCFFGVSSAETSSVPKASVTFRYTPSRLEFCEVSVPSRVISSPG